MAGRPLRALLVEDDPSARNVIRRQLEALGWMVVAFGAGEEAVNAVANGLHVDLLLSDMHLPGINGVMAADMVMRLAPHVRVVYMSGGSPPATVVVSRAPFLRKPFSTASLAGVLAAAISD